MRRLTDNSSQCIFDFINKSEKPIVGSELLITVNCGFKTRIGHETFGWFYHLKWVIRRK